MAQMSGFVWTASAGETFDMIALAVYGNEKYACDLMDANPKWARTARFEAGKKSPFRLFWRKAAKAG